MKTNGLKVKSNLKAGNECQEQADALVVWKRLESNYPDNAFFSKRVEATEEYLADYC
jgi:hypothetical protein